MTRLRADTNKLLPKYLAKLLHEMWRRGVFLDLCHKWIGQAGVNNTILSSVEIPMPPLAEQERLVAELEGYRKIIEGARQIIANYKPTIRFDSKWEMVRLEDVCSIKRGRFSYRPRNAPQFYGGPYPFMQTGDVVKSAGGPVSHTQTLNELGLSVSKLFTPPAVLITIAANIGDTGLLTYPACFPDSVVALVPNEQLEVKFLELAMRGKKQELSDLAPQAAQKNINVEILRVVEIPLPRLAVQREIVAAVDAELALLESNRKLIEIFEAKTKTKLDEIWGDNDHKGQTG
jgi:type I restriction enzyme S subunit